MSPSKPVDAGLCETCRNARIVRSDRGSVFYLCELSFQDPAYRKYPSLPVESCEGYHPNEFAESVPAR